MRDETCGICEPRSTTLTYNPRFNDLWRTPTIYHLHVHRPMLTSTYTWRFTSCDPSTYTQPMLTVNVRPRSATLHVHKPSTTSTYDDHPRTITICDPSRTGGGGRTDTYETNARTRDLTRTSIHARTRDCRRGEVATYTEVHVHTSSHTPMHRRPRTANQCGGPYAEVAAVGCSAIQPSSPVAQR